VNVKVSAAGKAANNVSGHDLDMRRLLFKYAIRQFSTELIPKSFLL